MHTTKMDLINNTGIVKESKRSLDAIQNINNFPNEINLIAASNNPSAYVQQCMEAVRFPYVVEGYIGGRFHEGGELLDELEQIAIEETCNTFKCREVIVQPWRCTNAIVSTCIAMAKPGDTIMGLSCSSGGYYVTGNPHAHFLSDLFKITTYDVRPDTYLLDYDLIEQRVKEEKPSILFCGDTSYSRFWDWECISDIAKRHGALMVADVSQTIGLIASDLYPSPIPFADIVVFATYKTLRGPHGGVIITHTSKMANKIRKNLYPRTQGSANPAIIAGISAAMEEASTPQFHAYSNRVVDSAKALSNALLNLDINILTNGTDNHSLVVELPRDHPGGANAVCTNLRQYGVLTNRTPIPFDPLPLSQCSGIRIGTSSIALKNHLKIDINHIAEIISTAIKNPGKYNK